MMTTSTMNLFRPWFHGYSVVLATFLLLFSAIGTFNSAALLVVPLETTFHDAGRGVIAVLPTLYLSVALFSSMGAGWIQDSLQSHNLPIQPVFVLGGLFIGLGSAGSSYSNSLSYVLLFAVLTGVGIGLTGFTAPGVCVLWFERSKGTMLLLAMAGQGLGGYMYCDAMQRLLRYYEDHGEGDAWRPAMRIIGIVSVVITVASSTAMRLPEKNEVEEHESKHGFISLNRVCTSSTVGTDGSDEDFAFIEKMYGSLEASKVDTEGDRGPNEGRDASSISGQPNCRQGTSSMPASHERQTLCVSRDQRLEQSVSIDSRSLAPPDEKDEGQIHDRCMSVHKGDEGNDESVSETVAGDTVSGTIDGSDDAASCDHDSFSGGLEIIAAGDRNDRKDNERDAFLLDVNENQLDESIEHGKVAVAGCSVKADDSHGDAEEMNNVLFDVEGMQSDNKAPRHCTSYPEMLDLKRSVSCSQEEQRKHSVSSQQQQISAILSEAGRIVMENKETYHDVERGEGEGGGGECTRTTEQTSVDATISKTRIGEENEVEVNNTKDTYCAIPVPSQTAACSFPIEMSRRQGAPTGQRRESTTTYSSHDKRRQLSFSHSERIGVSSASSFACEDENRLSESTTLLNHKRRQLSSSRSERMRSYAAREGQERRFTIAASVDERRSSAVVSSSGSRRQQMRCSLLSRRHLRSSVLNRSVSALSLPTPRMSLNANESFSLVRGVGGSSFKMVNNGTRRCSMAEYEALTRLPVNYTVGVDTVDDEEKKARTTFGLPSLPTWDVLSTKTAISLLLWYFLSCFAYANLDVHMPAYAESVGLPSDVGARALGLNCVFMLLGNVTLGWATDIIGPIRVMQITMTVLMACFFVWPLCQSSASLVLLACVAGYAASTQGSLPLIIIADAFGETSPNSILTLLGIMNVSKFPGYLSGPSVVGSLFELSRDYVSGAIFTGVMMFAGNVFLFLIPSTSEQHKTLIAEHEKRSLKT